MKTVAIKNESGVRLGVTGASDEIKKRLLGDYYTEENGACVRAYPADTPNIDKIIAAFEKYGLDYVAQVYGDKPAPWQDALAAFLERVRDLDIGWLLMGSCALAVRGIELKPRGVDFVMRIADLDTVRGLFADTTIVPFSKCPGWVCLGYGAAFLGAQISIGFGPQSELDAATPADSGPYAMAHAETVEWRGYKVNVPPVELSLNINKARGRAERVALIEKFMAGK